MCIEKVVGMKKSILVLCLYSGVLTAGVDFQSIESQNREGILKHNKTSVLKVDHDIAKNPECRDFIQYAQNEMNTTGLIVIKDNKALIELYARGANEKTKTKMWSISKFLSGLMLGAQVKEQGMSLLDRSLQSFGIERKANEKDSFNEWSAVKLRNVWNMSSGFNWCEYGNCRAVDAASIMYGKNQKDSVKYVLSQPLSHEPGTYYRYSAGNYVLLQAALRAMMPSQETYLNLPYSSVLSKLDVKKEDYAFEVDGKGIILGGSGLSLAPRAFAKLGQLLLNKGKYNGKTIIPTEFFEEMTRNSDAIKNSPFAVQNWEGPAGGSIWLNDDSSLGDGTDRDGIPSFMPRNPFDMIYAGGNFGQFLLVYPSSQLVVARIGGDSDHSRHWNPFSEKALECFDPSALRETVIAKEEKKAPDTGKNLGLNRLWAEGILPNSRAQETCSCLFVAGYESVDACDAVIPTKTELLGPLNSHNIVGRPKVDWRTKTVSVKRYWGEGIFRSQFDPEKPQLGCQLLEPVFPKEITHDR